MKSPQFPLAKAPAQRIPPFKTLDAFRGLAAIWVVLVHSVTPWIGSGNWAYLRSPFYALSTRGQLGVSIFFVISGYCIAAAAFGALVSGKSVWRYFYERVRRIYPPYLAALILTVLSATILGLAESRHLIGTIHHFRGFPHTFRYWFANIFLLQNEFKTDMANDVFWSLGYEVAFYFMIGLILKCAQWLAAKRGLYVGILVFVNAIGASTIAALTWLLVTGEGVFPFDLWHQFSIGALLFFLLEFNPKTVRGYDSKLRGLILANGAIVTILTLAFISFRQVGSEDVSHPSSRLRSAMCLVFCALLFTLRKVDGRFVSSWAVKPLLCVGTFSYSLYLTHKVAIPYADFLCRRAGLDGPLYWITVVVQVVFSLIVGYLSFLLIERRFISKRQVRRISQELIEPSLLPQSLKVER
jgi:peptidoglycan/LPS O-acetylase OafA/YrhL